MGHSGLVKRSLGIGNSFNYYFIVLLLAVCTLNRIQSKDNSWKFIYKMF